MDAFDPFPVSSMASVHETVRSPHYRWNSLRRGDRRQIILQRTLTGCGWVRVGRKKSRVDAGRCLIVAVPEDAEYWFDPGAAREWTFQWINIQGAWIQDLWLGLRQRFGAVLGIDPRGAAARAFSTLAADLAAHRLQHRREQAEACHALFLAMWIELEGRTEGPISGARELRELIQRRHREPVNIKELCGQIGLSREHLTREFRAEFGTEPAAWMRQLRLEAAETHLRHGTASLDEIARRVGFGSGRQLARAFRAARGLTPTEFRSQAGTR